MKHKLTTDNRQLKTKLYAVILAGGAGERFWPVSRMRSPKYTMKIVGTTSLIQQTVRRLKGLIPSEHILIVTNKHQIDLIRNKLKGMRLKNFLIEPCSRNTAAAIGLAAIYIRKKDPGAMMAVFPADHYIKEVKVFQSIIRKAARVAQDDFLVTLGIKPTFPSTGYGYIRIKDRASRIKNQKLYYEVERFIEKPDRKTAEKFLKSNRFFWNSGIFVWKLSTILDNLKIHMPKLYSSLLKMEKVLDSPRFKKDILRIYSGLRKISIDYGVMEKARKKALVLAKFDWVDLGSWLSLEEIYKKDRDRNVYKGLNINYDTEGSTIFGPEGHLIATCGVRDLVIVHTKDATLVAGKGKTQEVKKLVNLISKRGLKQYL